LSHFNSLKPEFCLEPEQKFFRAEWVISSRQAGMAAAGTAPPALPFTLITVRES
jgi:hypothetical protein